MKDLIKVLSLGFALCGMECSAQTVSGQEDGFDYVDLGLKSGTMWATYNVGAASAIEFGDFFAWGETDPKTNYSKTTYKWLSDDQYTKYCSSFLYGEVDDKSVLDAEDDAATAKWGPNWRMPTSEEQEELIEGCNWEFTNDFNGTGVPGCIGTSKTNMATIFLPAAGSYDGESLWGVGYYGNYLSSTLEMSEYVTIIHAADFEVSSGTTMRYKGNSVRPVVSHKENSSYYVVSFFTRDSVLIQSQNVEKEHSAEEPVAPKLSGYKFIGWSDSSFVEVTKDLKVYAQYIEYNVDELTATVSGTIGGYAYVDLGLPSGTKWATYNVGATKLEEYGDYFAWGETKPKEIYDWCTYKWCTYDERGYLEQFTKYCNSNSIYSHDFIDNKNVLEKEDDAASVNWGGAWRTPSIEELKELVDECDWVWTNDFNDSGVAGFVGISNSNGNIIFLPAAGHKYYDTRYINSSGYYWSNTVALYDACAIIFDDYDIIFDDFSFETISKTLARSYGLTIRAVVSGNVTNVSKNVNQALQVYTDNGTIHITNAQPNTDIKVFDMNGKAIASSVTDGYGNAELSAAKGVYVVTVGNMSTKVILE